MSVRPFIFMLLLLACSVAAQAGFGDYYRFDNSISGNWSFADMTYTPENATCGKDGYCEYVIDIHNKLEVTGYVFNGYRFDENVTSDHSAYLEKNVSWNTTDPTYGWVIKNYQCDYSANLTYDYNGTGTNYSWCYYENGTVIFEHFFNYVSIPQKKIWWREWGVNGTKQTEHSEMRFVKVPNDKFRKIIKNDKELYFNDVGWPVEAGSRERAKVRFKADTNAGKFDGLLIADGTDDWTCILDDSCAHVGVIDPYWNSTSWADYAHCREFDVNETDGIDRTWMVVNKNFSGLTFNQDYQIRIVNQS